MRQRIAFLDERCEIVRRAVVLDDVQDVALVNNHCSRGHTEGVFWRVRVMVESNVVKILACVNYRGGRKMDLSEDGMVVSEFLGIGP